MKRAFWKELGSLTGAVPSGRTKLNIRTDTHKQGGMKRREQTCQDKERTWQLGSRSINNTVDKGLRNVFLKCDISAFNGNWAGENVIHCMSSHKNTHFALLRHTGHTADVLFQCFSVLVI